VVGLDGGFPGSPTGPVHEGGTPLRSLAAVSYVEVTSEIPEMPEMGRLSGCEGYGSDTRKSGKASTSRGLRGPAIVQRKGVRLWSDQVAYLPTKPLSLRNVRPVITRLAGQSTGL
jgi:hypothetical protein